MLPVPLLITVSFFIELVGCGLYALSLFLIASSKQSSLKNPFFTLFISTGVAGILVVTTFWLINFARYIPAHPEDSAFCYFALISVGASLFWYTIGKFFIMIHRFFVLAKPDRSSSEWSNSTTTIVILCQYVLPTIANLGYLFGPINWTNGIFDGLTNFTGSIVRATTGIFYAIFAIISVPLNVFIYRRLRKLSSVAFYKEQRSLVIYTITSTSTHLMIALHQFVWAYVFFADQREWLASIRDVIGVIALHQFVWAYVFFADQREWLASIRDVRLIVYDLAIFVDPLVLLILSKQVRRAVSQKIFGSSRTTHLTTTQSSVIDKMYKP